MAMHIRIVLSTLYYAQTHITTEIVHSTTPTGTAVLEVLWLPAVAAVHAEREANDRDKYGDDDEWYNQLLQQLPSDEHSHRRQQQCW